MVAKTSTKLPFASIILDTSLNLITFASFQRTFLKPVNLCLRSRLNFQKQLESNAHLLSRSTYIYIFYIPSFVNVSLYVISATVITLKLNKLFRCDVSIVHD